MTKQRFFLTSAAVLLMSAGTAMADLGKTVSFIEIAEKNCASQWRDYAQLGPNAWGQFDPIDVDPELSPATHDAVNKYFAASVALAIYMGPFIGFTNPKNQSERSMASAQAQYNLVVCLTPTEVERELFLELGSSNGIRSDEGNAVYFEGFDQFQCMRMDDASEQIFDLDPLSQTFASDAQKIINTTMKVCD